MARLCPEGKLRRALETLDAHPEAGLSELDELARKYPKDAHLRALTGIAYLDEGEAWRALPHLERAVGRDPDPDWLEALEEAYEELEMPLHAAQIARREGRNDSDDLLERLPGAPRGMPRKDQLEFERGAAEIVRQGRAGLQRAEAIAAKYPDYANTANLLATGCYLQGDTEDYHRAARSAIERWPRDARALLNAVRSGILADGWDGARKWAGSLLAAEGIDPYDTLTLRARIATYLDDPDALDAVLLEYIERPDLDDDDEVFAYHLELLSERALDPDAPLLRLEMALAAVLSNVADVDGGVDPRQLKRYLSGTPGLLKILPDLLGYARPPLARAVAAVLLMKDAPTAPGAPWPDVLAQVARAGPGRLANRAALMAFLVGEGNVPPDEGLEYPGPPGDEERRVTLLFGPQPSGLPSQAEARVQEAVRRLGLGDVDAGVAMLAEIHEQFPQNHFLEHSLALAESELGPAGAKRANEGIERLIRQHPHVLILRGQAALEALGEHDLERAEELLTLPPGDLTANYQDYALFLGAKTTLAYAQGETERAAELLDALAPWSARNTRCGAPWPTISLSMRTTTRTIGMTTRTIGSTSSTSTTMKTIGTTNSTTNSTTTRTTQITTWTSLPTVRATWTISASPSARPTSPTSRGCRRVGRWRCPQPPTSTTRRAHRN